MVAINPDVGTEGTVTDKELGEGRHIPYTEEPKENEIEDDVTTTTMSVPTTTAYIPTYMDECRLPYEPAEDPDGAAGWRFGI